PEGGQGCSPDHACLPLRGHDLPLRRDRRNRRARCPRHPPGRSSRLALVHPPPRAGQYHHHSAAAEVPRATRSRTSGSSCATTGSPTASSNPTTISSTIVVRHGTSSSISLGASCPSDCANGPTGSDQWDLVLARVRELQAEHIKHLQPKLDISKERIGRRLDKASQIAEQQQNPANMVAAELGLAKVFHRVDQPDTTQKIDFNSAQSLQDIVRKLLQSIGFKEPDDVSIAAALVLNDTFISGLEQIRDKAQTLTVEQS